MISINPKDIPTSKLHGYLLSTIAPRPIAFASTIDKNGKPNLSPFSFFNVFSANPPVLIFSPARRVRNNTIKHTLLNAKETKEVVINIVNFDLVQQMSLSSTEYGEGVNEFEKAGLTMLKSDVIKPFRVAESPVQIECKVNDIIELGTEGGAGNLIICEVVKLHIKENILDKNGAIDQYKIDLVSRMGGNWYSRANNGMFEVPKPLSTLGIGVDLIPPEIIDSEILTGNDLGMLGNINTLPNQRDVDKFAEEHPQFLGIKRKEKHIFAQEFLKKKEIESAWKVLLMN